MNALEGHRFRGCQSSEAVFLFYRSDYEPGAEVSFQALPPFVIQSKIGQGIFSSAQFHWRQSTQIQPPSSRENCQKPNKVAFEPVEVVNDPNEAAQIRRLPKSSRCREIKPPEESRLRPKLSHFQKSIPPGNRYCDIPGGIFGKEKGSFRLAFFIC